MFVGHFAPALIAGAYPRSPRLPLLFVGAQFVDWLFFGFVLAGIEHLRIVPGFSEVSVFDLYDMPYTHSLVGSLGWALLFGGAVALLTRNRVGGFVAGAVVLSHWFLDWLVHMPDLTLAGAEPKLGLGLWNHAMLEMPLEIGITLAALWWYARKSGARPLRVLGLGALLLTMQAADWFGQKPAAVDAGVVLLAWFSYALATLAAWWAGRNTATA